MKDNIEKRIKDILNEKSKGQSVLEINDYIKDISQKINDHIQDMRDFQANSIEIIESMEDLFEDIGVIIKQLDLSLPLKIPQVIKKIRNISKDPPDFEILEKCFYFCHICIFLYYEVLISSYNELKEKIEKFQFKDFFLLTAKIELIKEAKMREASNSFNEDLIEKLWEDLKSEIIFIDNKIVNSSISSYFNNSNIKIFQKDLFELCEKVMKELDLKNSDPQNIFLKPFMKQNNLYYEID